MPAVPRSPVALAFVVYRGWTRLPPKQRRQALALAATHAPRVIALAASTTKKATAMARRRSP